MIGQQQGAESRYHWVGRKEQESPLSRCQIPRQTRIQGWVCESKGWWRGQCQSDVEACLYLCQMKKRSLQQRATSNGSLESKFESLENAGCQVVSR